MHQTQTKIKSKGPACLIFLYDLRLVVALYSPILRKKEKAGKKRECNLTIISMCLPSFFLYST